IRRRFQEAAGERPSVFVHRPCESGSLAVADEGRRTRLLRRFSLPKLHGGKSLAIAVECAPRISTTYGSFFCVDAKLKGGRRAPSSGSKASFSASGRWQHGSD
ncbi:unnamed protein product, partial [Scytosiphon promiscuus]